MSFFTPIRASNALITEANVPKTAVFVGGTDGIGKATLKALVSKGFPIKVYIVGRNEAGHQALLNDLRGLNPKAVLVYVEGQISLIADSQRVANQIAAQEEQIDLLFLSAGYLPFTGRQETSEGLEASQVVSYYSHVVFITRLLPQLRMAAKSTESVRVINVLAAGQESTDLFLDDLTLKHPGRFGIPNFASHAATSVTLTLKRISEAPENKDIVFIHSHPGLVSTDLFMKSWGGKFDPSQATAAPPAGKFVELTPEESGERCLYLITSAEFGGSGVPVQSGRQAAQTLVHGVKGSLFSINDKFEALQQDGLLADLEKMGAPQKIWDHTFGAIHSITKSD
ncbi:NAD(P)-binding protein [Thozetella sp. PMI_491]|nr:NAD(P)-binding protein [Thozetella sp. PMI_491]